jgi:dethiobiotin synthetase
MKSDRKAENLFIVGTDTGVGKTVLSLLLMQFFYAAGHTPFYIKPIQTGCRDPYDTDSDADFIYRHVRPLQDKDPAESVIYCFKNPKAPFFAARDEGKEIDLSVIERAVTQKSGIHFPLIIESAGGVMVPVTQNTLVTDLISLTKGTPIIAARAGLGTINHTLLTVEALDRRGINPLGIVFMDAGEKETPLEMVSENKEAIEEACGIKVIGIIGRIHDFTSPPQDCYQPLTIMFGQT